VSGRAGAYDGMPAAMDESDPDRGYNQVAAVGAGEGRLMAATSETCMCDCEECLALRAAEDGPGSGEIVAVFEHDGSGYEIDHLGIGPGRQWAEFTVYCAGEEVAEFAIAGSVLRPRSGPAGLPACADELVRLARQALSGRVGRDDPPRARTWTRLLWPILAATRRG